MYHIVRENKKEGPYTVEQLKQMGIRENTIVWSKGMKDWEKAITRADLLPIFTEDPPPLPGEKNPSLTKKRKSLQSLSIILITLSLGLMVFLYFIAFNNFSEEELISVSLLWGAPFTFGISGLLVLAFRSQKPWRATIITSLIIIFVFILLFISTWQYL